MNKYVLGALALTAASTPSFAGTDNWSVVDRDLEALASSLTPAATGASITGYRRSSYADSGDYTVGTGGNDLGGFSIDNASLIFTGGIADFSVRIETEASTDNVGGVAGQSVWGSTGAAGALGVLDAYAGWNITEQLVLEMGQFRAPFMASSMRDANNTLFIDRSLLGNAWAGRDQGIQIGGNFGMWGFAVAIQNGMDSAGDDLAFTGRVEVTPMGQTSTHEGALGATDDLSFTAGLGYYVDDGSVDDVVALGVDASLTVGIFGASVEFVDYDQGWGSGFAPTGSLSGPDGNGSGAGGVDTLADATPWNFTVSVMAMPDQLEVALRYEDLDDDEDTTVMTLGANWYMQGHAAKWQANYSTGSSDDDARDGDVIQVGLTVSI